MTGSGTREEFTHLHVASGFSMRYGTARPEALVARAAELGQPLLGLTDRDGLYGAVRFVRAAAAAGIDAVLGVDLAVATGDPAPAPRRTPVRGGAQVDPRHPRVTVLARGTAVGLAPGAGWAALCRLVTATHLKGERGTPISSPHLIARHCRVTGEDDVPSPLVVLLGPDSDVGRAVLARRDGEARARLQAWRQILPPDALVMEIVHHGGPAGTPGSRSHARRMLGLADEAGVPAILSAAVRHLDTADARTADVLDAARRLVPLRAAHLDQVTDAGHLADSATMWARAQDITGGSPGPDGVCARARRLVLETRELAVRTTQHPRHDLGIGAVHLPEPAVLGLGPDEDPQAVLARRCREAVPTRYPGATEDQLVRVHDRLDDELAVVAELGYPTYFLTVATVVDLIREMGVRVAARGSGAGSLINHLLGISGVDPIRHDLLMERFCSPLRAELPDIDIDVESDRRTEIYGRILERFSGERVTCVSMMDTYRVRHAVRDVGAALGMPPTEVDQIAKAFPHIRARDARNAIADLPELRAEGLDTPRMATFFDLVERLDGLPRHIALHPCGIVLSNGGLLDRTPVEASWLGFPMSQFDKDDVEALGLLKLDVLGIRMQSAMAHAIAEAARVEGAEIDLDDERCVPLDDEPTFRLIRSTHTLGCFQIESPGQRELIGKFGPQRFEDLIIDISLFRPGPVKSDMIRPFLEARHGWAEADHLHPTLVPALAETEGVVVFHEQMLRVIAETTGVTLAQADEVRRAMGSPDGQDRIESWWRPAASARGYTPAEVDRIWAVLKAFASFGFCKAHAAAFALPTYHSAWLKTHHPAAFLAGVLTHDPGMYPKRLILDDARTLGIHVLGIDVNASKDTFAIERVESWEAPPAPRHPDLPDGSRHGIRLSLREVKGISDAEVERIVGGQPYVSLADFWTRAAVSRPVVERLVMAGGFDDLHGTGGDGVGRRGRVTRRDLLLHVAELDRWSRSHRRTGKGRSRPAPPDLRSDLRSDREGADTRALAAAQSRAPRAVAATPVQLALDLGDTPELRMGSGLPEMTSVERTRAELDVLGLDVSAHVMEAYDPLVTALGTTRAADLLSARSGSSVLVAGVKVATQTPPIRTGRRVVFLTLDDASGPIDTTFFEDVQGPYAGTVFHSWLLLVRGVVRRTGERGISLRATGAWELSGLWEAWSHGGLPAVQAEMGQVEARARDLAEQAEAATRQAGRRVLVHASGFKQSPYADISPAGGDPRQGRGVPDLAPRKLWHASPGSAGH
ncbi:DNA polymerase III subunit alpha [Janibacter sp. G1551]|uniref:DNA polymerase III subunit alpha n=1 Tax=Janibacter sp. G1551 TaxID=3420440 RepID=UPI003CFCDDE8